MGPVQDSNQPKMSLLIAPDDYVSESNGFTMISLRHPKSKEGALFAVKNSEESQDIREIITLNQEFGAWFFGDVVESDGRLHLASPVDPLLLAIPYLRSAKRPMPLDHLLLEDEEEFPEVVNRLAAILIAKGLSHIAKALGSPDLNVWQFDEQKTLAYLAKKVDRVSKALAASGTPSDDDKRSAWQILSDYLEPEISTLLAKHLNIKDEPVKKPEPLSKPTTLTGSRSLPTGTKEGARPLEDYSEPKAKLAKLSSPPSSSAKQKALEKSASGSKNIMSFFSKK